MITVLVAGIGGASLGTEIAKSLRLAGRYRILGCDISPLAFGHYSGLFSQSFLVTRDRYIDDILDISRRHGVQVIIPGGEEPMVSLASAADQFAKAGLLLAMNSERAVRILSNKLECFAQLSGLGISVPRTVELSADHISECPLPCIIKPSLASGGSAFVFFARSRKEVEVYARYLTENGKRPLAQEYIPHDDGEFTVGVLSDLQGRVAGSIALNRAFHSKLSVAAKGEDFLISSGYSQGYIAPYDHVCAVACKIAEKVESVGPINIQGRIGKDGVFRPFEINPRFSASTYLRALAGFNEIDYFIGLLLKEQELPRLGVKAGWYLRSLDEAVVLETDLIK